MKMPDAASKNRDMYVPGYGRAAHDYMAVRSATDSVAFLVPHLRPGMHLLDCGCGPGTITLGLAEIVAPGEVVGVDRESLQVERARALADQFQVANVRFEVADLFQLPFPDASFDVVVAHAVLMHVTDRLAALREFHRVLRTGGIVAVKDIKTDHQILEPSTPLLRELLELLDRARRHNGIPTSAPHRYRALLREAGFIDVDVTASCVSYSTPEAIQQIAAFHLGQARGEAFQRTVLEQGWADQERLDAICSELEAWMDHPDAFRVELWCAGLGRSSTE
jgi:ubiquinone/menaquinone biosynthesis C-methylase UbiE